MALTIWNQMAEMERRVDDLFRELSWPRASSTAARLTGGFLPVADVFQRNNDLVVRTELPGIDPEKDVRVTLLDRELVISGERKQQTEVKEADYYRMESSYGSFERHVPVPEGVDESQIRAEYKDGVLEVVVIGAATSPKAPSGKPISITVQPAK